MKKSLVAAAAVAATGLAAAGCSSSSSSTTTSTRAAPPAGASTADEVAHGFVDALTSKTPDTFCTTYAQPSEETGCKEGMSEFTSSSITVKDLTVGDVVVQGSQALMNFTASICSGGRCDTISDPNSAMANGVPFTKAYANATNPKFSDDSVFAGAAVQQNGRWYATGF